MTDLQLTKLDIHSLKTKLKPNLYWCNTTQSEMKIFKSYTPKDVLQMIYDAAHEQGIEVGKQQRSQEFKSLLNIDDSEW